MQEVSESLEVPCVAEPALSDELVAVMAGRVGEVLLTKMSKGQTKQLMPDIAQAMLAGAEQYRVWKENRDRS